MNHPIRPVPASLTRATLPMAEALKPVRAMLAHQRKAPRTEAAAP
jgi:hypothetical protein